MCKIPRGRWFLGQKTIFWGQKRDFRPILANFWSKFTDFGQNFAIFWTLNCFNHRICTLKYSENHFQVKIFFGKKWNFRDPLPQMGGSLNITRNDKQLTLGIGLYSFTSAAIYKLSIHNAGHVCDLHYNEIFENVDMFNNEKFDFNTTQPIFANETSGELINDVVDDVLNWWHGVEKDTAIIIGLGVAALILCILLWLLCCTPCGQTVKTAFENHTIQSLPKFEKLGPHLFHILKSLDFSCSVARAFGPRSRRMPRGPSARTSFPWSPHNNRSTAWSTGPCRGLSINYTFINTSMLTLRSPRHPWEHQKSRLFKRRKRCGPNFSNFTELCIVWYLGQKSGKCGYRVAATLYSM